MKSKKTVILMLMTIVVGCTQEHLEGNRSGSDLLQFTSREQFETYVKGISVLPDKPIDVNAAESAGVETEGFVSFEEVYFEALDKLNAAANEDEIRSVLNEYSDVIVQDDETYSPRINSPLLMKMCNRERMYQTDKVVTKVLDDEYVVSSSAERVDELRKVESLNGLNKDVFKIDRYVGSKTEIDNARTASQCGNYQQASYYYNPSGCRDDRQVYVVANANFAYYQQCTFGDCGNIQTLVYPFVEVYAYGRIRGGGLSCNWSNYSTRLWFGGVYLHVDTYVQTYWDGYTTQHVRAPWIASIAEWAPEGDRPSITLISAIIGDFVCAEDPGDYGWIEVYAEAASRGTAGNFAVISCP